MEHYEMHDNLECFCRETNFGNLKIIKFITNLLSIIHLPIAKRSRILGQQLQYIVNTPFLLIDNKNFVFFP